MDELHHQSFDGYPLTNFEMETAGIYALAALLGHEAYSFSALLANRAAGTFHDEPAQAVEFAYPQGAGLGGGAGIKNPRLCTKCKAEEPINPEGVCRLVFFRIGNRS